jgi:uncharacterized protein YndB with AHSA1/START domain
MKKETLTQDVVYPHPVQRVWRALTHSSELSQWLLPNDFEPRVGHRFTFISKADQGWSGLVECEVVEVVPYRRLAYTWCADPRSPAMLITFTLEHVTGGTHLHLEQTAHSTLGWQAELIREALPSLHLSLGGPPVMSRFFRIMIDAEALTNALFEFVTNPHAPSRNELPVVQELHTFAPEMISVLENMLLDGVDERHYIDEYVNAIFGPMIA